MFKHPYIRFYFFRFNFAKISHIRKMRIPYLVSSKLWSGRRDSNSRPSPWQGDALPLSHFRIAGGRRWIRTIESSANGFTVRPLWPLGNPSTSLCVGHYNTIPYIIQHHFLSFFPVLYWSWRRESNPQPADYKSAALPLSHASASASSIGRSRAAMTRHIY